MRTFFPFVKQYRWIWVFWIFKDVFGMLYKLFERIQFIIASKLCPAFQNISTVFLIYISCWTRNVYGYTLIWSHIINKIKCYSISLLQYIYLCNHTLTHTILCAMPLKYLPTLLLRSLHSTFRLHPSTPIFEHHNCPKLKAQ